MTSAELPVLQFPVQLGYFKTLSTGKSAGLNAHARRLVSGDCWAEISKPAWQQWNNDSHGSNANVNKNKFILTLF